MTFFSQDQGKSIATNGGLYLSRKAEIAAIFPIVFFPWKRGSENIQKATLKEDGRRRVHWVDLGTGAQW